VVGGDGLGVWYPFRVGVWWRRGGTEVQERRGSGWNDFVEAFVGMSRAGKIVSRKIVFRTSRAEIVRDGRRLRNGVTVAAAARFFASVFQMWASIGRGDVIRWEGDGGGSGVALIESVTVAASVGIAFRIARIGRDGLGCGPDGWSAEVRKNGLSLNLAFAQGGEIVGDDFFFVEADLAGVGAYEAFVEDAAGKLVEAFVLDGAQHAGADFCDAGDSVEREATLLALLAKFVSERTHGGSGGAMLRPAC
jgi:hypothetical protein